MPFGRLAGARLKVGAAIASVYARTPVSPLASVAVTLKVKLPVAVGVPLKAPPLARLSPAGRAPLLTVNA